MNLIEEMRSELSALSEHFPKGATLPEVAGFFGVPLRQLEPAINALEMEGAVCLNGETVSFQTFGGGPMAQAAGAKGGAAAARERLKAEKAHAAAFDVRDAVVRARVEIGPSDCPSLEDALLRVKDALPLLADIYPHGVSAREMAVTLDLPIQRVYRVLADAETEGWCEMVKAYGNRQTGRVAVFDGMLVPPPQLTELQSRVLEWIKHQANGAPVVEVNMTRCAAELEMGMIQDKLDSMERKGFLARLTPYRERGRHGSPIYKVLPSPEPRPPVLWSSKTQGASDRSEAFAQELEERGYEAVSVEPIAVLRARERKRMIEAELAEIVEFLKTYDRLSK